MIIESINRNGTNDDHSSISDSELADKHAVKCKVVMWLLARWFEYTLEWMKITPCCNHNVIHVIWYTIVHQVCYNLVTDQCMEDFPLEVWLFLISDPSLQALYKVLSMQTLLTNFSFWITLLDVAISTWLFDHFPIIICFTFMNIIFSLITLKGVPCPFHC